MAKWKYKLKSGTALREAIDNEDTEQAIKCLLLCYKELLGKLSEEDRSCYEFDIEDSIEILTYYDADPDDEDSVNYYLTEFYDICDDVRAFVAL